ncbi:MAG: caspase family protein [Bacteroidaceae bacterium]|nr:caspase family protein [Bacteroidaceae bacterium]
MRRLLTISALLLLFAQCLCAKVYLVSVGIADYPGTENDLRISAIDAHTIANIFKKNGHASIVTLTDEKATQSAVLATLHTTFADAKTDDTVIFFFSGHGTQGELVCYDGFLPYQNLLAMLKGCPATKKIIMVDACYAGKMRSNKQQTNRYNSQNVMFFLSSRTNESSLESRFKNSMFTIFLERGLRGGADANKDRTITARELYDFVHSGVIKATNSEQHPVMWGKFDNDMPVIKW